jgi:hypothetical protein
MRNDAVTQLHAARRYLTGVLLHLNIDAESMTAYRLIELLDYFSDNPAEYIAFTNAQDE